MKLADLTAALFPYRTHLEREIEYLKAQLAQERRRVDVLTEIARPTSEAKMPRLAEWGASVSRFRPYVPKGWDATRAEERRHAETAPEVSAGPDAGSEGSTEDSRAMA